MVLEYGFGTSFTAVTSWIAPGGNFNWSSVVNTSTAAAVNGNTTGLVSNRGGTVTGLTWTDGQKLWLRWVERNDSGNDHGLAIDDLTFSAAASTNSTSSDIVAGSSFVPPANFNYLDYQAVDISDLNSLEVAQFTLRDGGATAPDSDALPTTLTNLVMSLSGNSSIRRVALYEGSTELGEVAGASSVSFSGLSIAAADDATKTYSVRVTFNTGVTDNQQFQFTITSASADAAGSSFASANAGGAASSVAGDDNRIEVTADRLAFVQNATSPTGVNVAMTPAPSVSANDVNGNRDLDFVSSVDITSTGTLQTSPVTVAAISGLATYSGSVIHTATGTGLQMTAAATGLTSITSTLFDIQAASSSTDYFRSAVSSGNWGTATSWESSSDNSNWIPATLVPDVNANIVRILNGHTITVAAAAGADQVIVDAGGTLQLNTDFTLADGSGTDLEVNGTVINAAGTHTINGSIQFNSGSLYQHNRNGGINPVLPATWHVNSTAEIKGVTNSQPTGLGQTFGNFIWNCESQSGNIGLGSPAGFSVAGNFTVTSTGGVSGRAVRFASSTLFTMTIGGNLVLNGGHLGLSSGTTAANVNLTVNGGLSITSGSELYLSVGSSSSNVLNILGDIVINNGTITETGSATTNVINFSRSGSQSFSATSATLANDLNFTVKNGSVTTLLTNIPINLNRTFLVESGAVLDAGTNQITGAGGVTVNGTLKSANANGIGSTGTLAISGTVTLGAASAIALNAAGSQPIAPRSDYVSLSIDGGGIKSLSGNTTILGSVTLTNGKIQLGNSNLIVGGTITGGSSSNYIVTDGTGVLTVNAIGASPKTLPVGNAKYNPLTITNGSGHNWSARVIDGLTADPGFNTNKAVLVTWDITPSVNPPTGGADISFQFDEATQVGASFNTGVNIQAWRRPNDAYWFTAGTPGSLNTSVPNAATFTVTGLTGFSKYALSNVDGPLPVQLSRFSAYRDGYRNQLRWTTSSEVTNRGFEVQRSDDGYRYSVIGFVPTLALNGNSVVDLEYRFTDPNPGPARNHYRLRQVDVDGHDRYSNVVLLRTDAGTLFGLESLLPNPVRSVTKAIIHAPEKGTVTLLITHSSGQVMMRRVVAVDRGANIIPLELNDCPAGVYVVQLVGSDAFGGKSLRLLKL